MKTVVNVFCGKHTRQKTTMTGWQTSTVTESGSGSFCTSVSVMEKLVQNLLFICVLLFTYSHTYIHFSQGHSCSFILSRWTNSSHPRSYKKKEEAPNYIMYNTTFMNPQAFDINGSIQLLVNGNTGNVTRLLFS